MEVNKDANCYLLSKCQKMLKLTVGIVCTTYLYSELCWTCRYHDL